MGPNLSLDLKFIDSKIKKIELKRVIFLDMPVF